MTTTEDLYEQAVKAYRNASPFRSMPNQALSPGCMNGIRAVVDLVLAEREPTADGEALAQLVRGVRDSDPGYTTQIDGVLIAKCDEYGRVDAQYARQPQPWEVLWEAARIYHSSSPNAPGMENVTVDRLRSAADRLEAEHRAAQEAAEREAEREKLIEQAAQTMFAHHNPGTAWTAVGQYTQDSFVEGARALADAGFLTDPEALCCTYPDVCHECASYADEADPEAVTE